MAVDRARIEAAVVELLAAIGEDPTREGLTTTPRRVAEAYDEFFSGIGVDPAVHLDETFSIGESVVSSATPHAGAAAAAGAAGAGGAGAGADAVAADSAGISRPGEAVLLRDIQFRSICEHHLLPFLGVAHVAYLPDDRIVGLGRLPRVVETAASKPQMQERLTEEIADAIDRGLAPRGVLVVVDAVHGCVSARGVRQTESSTVTVASRGLLAEPVARAEIIALIGAGGRGRS